VFQSTTHLGRAASSMAHGQDTPEGPLQALAAACAAAEAKAMRAMLASQVLQGNSGLLSPAHGMAIGRPSVASALDSFTELLALQHHIALARLQAPLVPAPPVAAPTLPPLQPRPVLSWPANGGLPALLEVVRLAEPGTA